MIREWRVTVEYRVPSYPWCQEEGYERRPLEKWSGHPVEGMTESEARATLDLWSDQTTDDDRYPVVVTARAPRIETRTITPWEVIP